MGVGGSDKYAIHHWHQSKVLKEEDTDEEFSNSSFLPSSSSLQKMISEVGIEAALLMGSSLVYSVTSCASGGGLCSSDAVLKDSAGNHNSNSQNEIMGSSTFMTVEERQAELSKSWGEGPSWSLQQPSNGRRTLSDLPQQLQPQQSAHGAATKRDRQASLPSSNYNHSKVGSFKYVADCWLFREKQTTRELRYDVNPTTYPRRKPVSTTVEIETTPDWSTPVEVHDQSPPIKSITSSRYEAAQCRLKDEEHATTTAKENMSNQKDRYTPTGFGELKAECHSPASSGLTRFYSKSLIDGSGETPSSTPKQQQQPNQTDQVGPLNSSPIVNSSPRFFKHSLTELEKTTKLRETKSRTFSPEHDRTRQQHSLTSPRRTQSDWSRTVVPWSPDTLSASRAAPSLLDKAAISPKASVRASKGPQRQPVFRSFPGDSNSPERSPKNPMPKNPQATQSLEALRSAYEKSLRQHHQGQLLSSSPQHAVSITCFLPRQKRVSDVAGSFRELQRIKKKQQRLSSTKTGSRNSNKTRRRNWLFGRKRKSRESKSDSTEATLPLRWSKLTDSQRVDGILTEPAFVDSDEVFSIVSMDEEESITIPIRDYQYDTEEGDIVLKHNNNNNVFDLRETLSDSEVSVSFSVNDVVSKESSKPSTAGRELVINSSEKFDGVEDVTGSIPSLGKNDNRA